MLPRQNQSSDEKPRRLFPSDQCRRQDCQPDSLSCSDRRGAGGGGIGGVEEEGGRLWVDWEVDHFLSREIPTYRKPSAIDGCTEPHNDSRAMGSDLRRSRDQL